MPKVLQRDLLALPPLIAKESQIDAIIGLKADKTNEKKQPPRQFGFGEQKAEEALQTR